MNMKKKVKVKLIIFILVIGLFSNNIILAEDSDNNVMVVTANRSEQKLENTLAHVTVITREDIDLLQPTSFAELLDGVPGFDIIYQGGPGQLTSVFARGAESDHTLILINGVRVGSATDGKKALNTIPVSQIERIEIVKGPRAALWGSDAIGGVINIFMRQAKTLTWQMRQGTHGLRESSVSFGFGSDRLQNSVSVGYRQQEGFDVFDDATDTTPDTQPDDDGFRELTASFRGAYQLSEKLQLDWSAQVEQGNQEFDSSFGGNESDYTNHLWQIQYTYTTNETSTQFAVQQSRDSLLTYGNAISKTLGELLETRRQQVTWVTHYAPEQSRQWQWSVGVDAYNDRLDTRNLAFGLTFSETERDTRAVFVNSLFSAGDFSMDISLRRDEVTDFYSDNSFNLGLGYQLTSQLSISFQRAKAFKAPSFNDLFGPFGGNPDLESEESFNNELSFKWHYQKHALSLQIFENEISNLINFRLLNGLFLPFNTDATEIEGQELSYTYQHGSFSHQLGLNWLDARNVSLDLNNSPLNSPLLRRANKQYRYQLTWQQSNFRVNTQLHYVSERFDRDFSTLGSPFFRLPSYVQLDLAADYDVSPRWRLGLKIEDATDKAPTQVLQFVPSGRQIILSMTWNG